VFFFFFSKFAEIWHAPSKRFASSGLVVTPVEEETGREPRKNVRIFAWNN
jgi:hypothetical protein